MNNKYANVIYCSFNVLKAELREYFGENFITLSQMIAILYWMNIFMLLVWFILCICLSCD